MIRVLLRRPPISSLHFSCNFKSLTTMVPRPTLTQLFEKGRNCNGILALVSELYLNPSAGPQEGISMGKNTGFVPGLGECTWLLLIDAHQHLAPPGSPGAENASSQTRILAEMLQIMSPRLDFGTPPGAEEVQIAIIRQVFFDPVGENLWPAMRATADGPKQVCDSIMAVEQDKGDEWCQKIARNLGRS